VPALLKAVSKADLVYCWFASWHSMLPVMMAKALRKPSIVIVGGYDVTSLPEAGYGSQRGGMKKRITRITLKNATRLVAFSQYAAEETRNAVPARRSVDMIYLGVTPVANPRFEQRARRVLTVGAVWRENLLRKGLLPFVQTAHFFPDLEFVHAGAWYDNSIERLRQAASPNVQFLGYVSDEKLDELFATSLIYVQGSLHEGFGLSLAQAMSGGCIPVVTAMGSIPEVVGEAGVYTASNSPAAIAAAIRQALALGENASRQARERILTTFPPDQRRQALFSLIDETLLRGQAWDTMVSHLAATDEATLKPGSR
jgi:glycosyltransferase involved in cell wall biosynthesis